MTMAYLLAASALIFDSLFVFLNTWYAPQGVGVRADATSARIAQVAGWKSRLYDPFQARSQSDFL
jgi:hypothetical protein